MASSDFDSIWGPGLENVFLETQVGGQQAVVCAAKAHMILITSEAVRRPDSHARSASNSNRNWAS